MEDREEGNVGFAWGGKKKSVVGVKI